jgi:hypothetical protein
MRVSSIEPSPSSLKLLRESGAMFWPDRRAVNWFSMYPVTTYTPLLATHMLTIAEILFLHHGVPRTNRRISSDFMKAVFTDGRYHRLPIASWFSKSKLFAYPPDMGGSFQIEKDQSLQH